MYCGKHRDSFIERIDGWVYLLINRHYYASVFEMHVQQKCIAEWQRYMSDVACDFSIYVNAIMNSLTCGISMWKRRIFAHFRL